MSDKVRIEKTLQELIPQFLKSRSNDVLTLRRLLKTKKWQEISKLVHKIKGTSAVYGFDFIFQNMQLIETCLESCNFLEIENEIEKLDKFLKNVEIEYYEEK